LIGEANHLVPGRAQEGVSLGIVLALFPVESSVQLDDQTVHRAAEIDHEWTDRMLTAKFQSMEAPTAERFPENPLN